MSLRDLMERRDKVLKDMQTIHSEADGKPLDGEKQSRWDALETERAGLDAAMKRQALFDEAERRSAEGISITGSGDARFDQAVSQYSIRNAMAGAAGLDVDWGRERELSRETERRMGVKAKGVMVPLNAGAEQRVLTTTTPSGGPGSNLVATDHLGGQFIDLLRSNIVVQGLGARMLTGLTGDVEVPGLKESATAHWFAENTAISSSTHQFRQVAMAPKHVGALTEFSRNMLLQSSPDVEALIRSDFAAVIARAVDLAALVGGGTSEPDGILSTSGISEVADFAATWAKVQELVGALEDENSEGTAFVMHTLARRKFRTTNRVADEPEHGFLMEGRNTLDDYPVRTTTQMPVAGTPATTSVLHGNFSDLLIGMWSGLDLLANPYAADAYEKGNVQFRAITTMDVAVRHAASFAFGDLDVS